MDIPWNPAILEQRIARVHRMGQGKTVRVVNFVTRASIEERILDLLRFKKSLFTGALDDDGMDVVMIGQSGMEKFMQSVEDAVDTLERPDPALEKQERREAAEDEDAAAFSKGSETGQAALQTPAAGNGNGIEALNSFLVSGAQFLMNLSQAISQPPQEKKAAPADQIENPVQNVARALLDRDEATGKTYLKIPLPETEVLTQVFSGLGQLLSGFMQMQKNHDD